MAKDTVPSTQTDGLTLVEDLPTSTDLPSNEAEVPGLEPEPEFQDPGPFETEQSQLKATQDQHKKAGHRGKAGGNNKDGFPAKVAAPQQIVAIPRPNCSMYKSDATNTAQRTKSGWTYWNLLPTWAKDRTLAYVYRDWPILKMIPEDNETDYAYIDKISGSEPIQDDTDLLKRYGCGSYRVIFNEQPGRTLFTAYVYNLGGTDLKSFPPSDRRVSDVDQVDLDRKENQSYKDHLRMRGLLPEQNIGRVKESEMATVEAVKEMASSTERMANKMVEMAEKRNDGGNLTGEMIRESIKTANEITKNAVDHAFKVQDREGTMTPVNQGPSFTEMFDMVTNLMATMQAKSGAGGADPVVMAELASLRSTVTEMQNQRIRALEEELRAARTNPQPQTQNTQSSLFDQIKALKELKGLIDEIGVGNREENPVLDAVKDNSPPWLKAALQIAPVFANVLAARMGMPPMPQAPAQPQTQPQSPAPQQLQLVPPTATNNPAPTQDDLGSTLNYVAMPLLNYLAEPEMNGDYFAEWVVSGFGDEIFEEVRKRGAAAVIQAIKVHPITGPGLQQIQGMTDQRLEKFVNEFMVHKVTDDGVDMTTDVAISPGPGAGA